MIADILNKKKLKPIVTELFIRRKKLNISLVFIAQSYLALPKNIRLNSTRYFVVKITNKRELQQIDFQDFKNILQNHILFWLLILLLHQITFHALERIF